MLTPGLWFPNSSPSTPAAQSEGDFDLDIIYERDGLIVFRATGAAAEGMFRDEPGGHRWQRVPPNEKRGRVHTSTITVAVLPEAQAADLKLTDKELSWSTCRGTGSGGQKRNKTSSTVRLKHEPSGTQVRCETSRSQLHNREAALAMLRARLLAAQQSAEREARETSRKSQVGTGMRGDKRRTVRCQDGIVTDHLTGRRWDLKSYLRGEW